MEPVIDVSGLEIAVEFRGQHLPARVVSETLAIDGHGQPADKDSLVTIVVNTPDLLSKADALRSWIRNQGYGKVIHQYQWRR